MIRIDAFPGFFAVHVLSELIKIEPKFFGIRFKQFARIRSITPEYLFPIQHVVHLPETALQPRGFCSQRGFASVLMSRERKIPKNNAQSRIVLFHELICETGEAAAGRALKIAKFFQRYRSVRVAANVH